MTSDSLATPISLRITQPEDLEFVILAERQAARFVLEWPRERHEGVVGNPDWDHLIVTAGTSSTPVGFILLGGLQDSDNNLNLKRIVITQPGKGYGRAAIRAVMSRAFNQHGAHRLWLDVRTYNERARSLYESEGFVAEGVLRECDRVDDHYESLVIMSILEQEYRLRPH